MEQKWEAKILGFNKRELLKDVVLKEFGGFPRLSTRYLFLVLGFILILFSSLSPT